MAADEKRPGAFAPGGAQKASDPKPTAAHVAAPAVDEEAEIKAMLEADERAKSKAAEGKARAEQAKAETPKPAKSPKPARPPIDGASDGAEGGPPPRTPPAQPVSRAPYTVAPGVSLTSPRGVLSPGDEIRPSDVSDGAKQLDYLASRGLVVKRKVD
jgi:hypothetical protein